MRFRIWRRCTSPKTMTWSTHSRRIDPISRSATPFCQGEAGAVGLSRMPMAKKLKLQESRVVIHPGVASPRVVRYVFWGDQWPIMDCGQKGGGTHGVGTYPGLHHGNGRPG